MSTHLWQIDTAGDEADPLPACSTCRKRKLRCSREGPPCYHCSRTGTECSYDPKQKPGLKPGAVDALNRRVAFLEKILLTAQGEPRVHFSDDGRVVNPRQPPSNSEARVNQDSVDEQDGSGLQLQNGTESYEPIQPVVNDESDEAQVLPNFDTIHLKRDDPGLPSVSILLEVADYFCQSFHHWIPFLHKGLWKRKIEQQNLSRGDRLVLHAAVATVLPHLKWPRGQGTFDATSQARVSREFVLRLCLTELSLQSAQALVILLFDDLNEGRVSASCGLIGILTRAVDYLQLGVEPDASHSKVLMKRQKILPLATDWTELESRRRLFWCIFLLDRYTSATMGLNISLTAEDVNRRLPADGYYFAAEQPVLCPIFGLWNKTFAKLGVPLSAHVPAQYNDGDTQTVQLGMTTSPGVLSNSSRLDASKLGAFAYCIEATESLNQITTFFLQQGIDWRNQMEVENWIMRFKELDLRLVHWKQFLPAHWKDSNISVDKSQVSMDPNLTLAHMTHNTSMILLHYSIAWPPEEWTSLIQLPSACSIETCRLAASEISHIAAKFLRHTDIPCVNAQFSFCVMVAAKLLLVMSQASGSPIHSGFSDLVQLLWTISARWQSESDIDKYRRDSRHARVANVAQTYAQFLEKLCEKCRDDRDFRFDLLDHSCSSLGHSPRTPLNNVANTVQALNAGSNQATSRKRGANEGNSLQGQAKRRGLAPVPQHDPVTGASSHSTESRHETCHNANHARTSATMAQQKDQTIAFPQSMPGNLTTLRSPAASWTTNSQDMEQPIFDPNLRFRDPQQETSVYQPLDNSDGWLSLSNTLMNSQYMDLDRVITLEDANFHTMYYEPSWPD